MPHNFVWHEHWTWKDRTAAHGGALGRLPRFNLSNGLISIGVNLIFMRVLAGRFHFPYMAANGASNNAAAFSGRGGPGGRSGRRRQP